MGGVEDGWGGWPPAPGGAPPYVQKDDHWTHFDNSVNAVSFGFVATAILISMFLVMAIFEKLLRTTSPDISPAGGRRGHSDIEAQGHNIARFDSKLAYPSPKVSSTINYYFLDVRIMVLISFLILLLSQISVNAREVSVVMPGNNLPTFIANPAPVPCPPDRMPWPSHQQQPNLPDPHSSS
ncbi:hypothetical protein PHJA_001970600 [Phtheirospermum japonicum]|uniref:Uncharacterized protein n=1 Tax=Phtheirospermum japonicum TaxID=374723 RepID=A0A830CBW8_9LAMI|nr:hypothetical protein PHJA_001970600 [Phtheirospermum japonicum]